MVSKKYVPNSLTNIDSKKQTESLRKSRKLYKKGIYYVRPKIKSFKSKISPHILKARKLYSIKSIKPSKELAKKTKCSMTGLKKIVKKGMGAYYSSGSRPSQSAESWGIARLASAITGGKSSKVDYHLLKKYCSNNSKALKMASKLKSVVTNKVSLNGGGSKNKGKPPKRNKKNEIIFEDVIDKYPQFKPNLSPKEIFKLGSFGGTYFRPIKSKVVNKQLKNQHKEYKKYGWFNLDESKYVTSQVCNPSLNKYGVKSGTSLDFWESKGWINKIDPYGWFQWYCRFYVGRRCYDDDRQINRWIKFAGEKSGRWRLRLINMCKKKKTRYDDISISPVIRQGLQHWAYVITKDDLK
jgi:hypothetical protein